MVIAGTLWLQKIRTALLTLLYNNVTSFFPELSIAFISAFQISRVDMKLIKLLNNGLELQQSCNVKPPANLSLPQGY